MSQTDWAPASVLHFALLCVIGLTVAGSIRHAEHTLAGKRVWAGFEGDPGGFCEGLSDRAADFLREPTNAWSSLDFLCVGMAIILTAYRCAF